MFTGLRQLLAQREELNEGASKLKGKQKEERSSHGAFTSIPVPESSTVLSNGRKKEERPNPDGQGGAIGGRAILTGNHPNRASGAKVITIEGREDIYSVVFMGDGKHILAGEKGGKIRCWRIEDGKEVGKPMDAASRGWVYAIAVSQDSKWVVSGVSEGTMRVFDAQSRGMVRELKGHTLAVNAMDVSPSGRRIVTGSSDQTARVWSLSTGEELRRLQHDHWVVAVKFSPNGRLFATATWHYDSVRIYSNENGQLLVDFKIGVGSLRNQSVAWHRNSKHLFVASHDGHIHLLDARNSLSKWCILTNNYPGYPRQTQRIASASDSTYIAVSAASSVSFWDVATREQFGPPVQHAVDVISFAISPNHKMVVSEGNTIILRDLHDILPARYLDSVSVPPQTDYSAILFLITNSKDTRALFNKLTDVRNQLRVATLTAELDRLKRSLAIKTDKLAAVRGELSRFPDVSHEILSARRDLKTFEAWIHGMDQQYEVQLGEITSGIALDQPESPPIQHPIADSEVYAEKALIRTLESLNGDIRRTSRSISTHLIHHIQSPDAGEQSLAIQRASMSIPMSLVNRLRTMSHLDQSLYLSIAFQAHLTSYSYHIISLWCSDKRIDELLSEMYARLCESASPAFAATWRSLTHTNMPDCTSEVHDPQRLVSHAIQGLADIAVTADCAALTSDTVYKLSSKFGSNISFLITTAQKLGELVRQAVEVDYKVILVPSGQKFDEVSMVVYADGGLGMRIGKEKGKKVLCTTHLGLIKRAIQGSQNPGPSINIQASTTSTVLKTSVVLHENR